MNRRINKLLNTVTASLLSLLGFSSCSNGVFGGEEPCLYGSPTSDYHFKGIVTDENGTPIKGIKVVAQIQSENRIYREDSTYTDSNGAYQTADKSTFNAPNDVAEARLYVSFEDVDGEDNGGDFETTKAVGSDITVKQLSKGDGSWYSGKYELTADKKLNKKK